MLCALEALAGSAGRPSDGRDARGVCQSEAEKRRQRFLSVLFKTLWKQILNPISGRSPRQPSRS